jgi:hypothetical protein
VTERRLTQLEVPSLSQSFGNLLGVPSYHYQPVFAQAAVRALEEFQPVVVALECPPSIAPELDWAGERWPEPVVSLTGGWFFPFIPGDSIFETHRLAHSRGIEVALVDLDYAVPARDPRDQGRTSLDAIRPGASEHDQRPRVQLPGPELARAGGPLFLQTVEELIGASGPATSFDAAREAHMAQALSRLMETHSRVMWVGGAAHWKNLIDRIERADFRRPSLQEIHSRSFRRLRLLPSAMRQMTGRVPRLVARFAEDPWQYSEDAEIRALALDALESNQREGDVAIISLPGANNAVGDAINQDREEGTPIDVARLLLYARNLAVTRGMQERPSLFELLSSAVATVGSRYAGRLYMLAMQDPSEGGSGSLGWEETDEGSGYKVDGEWLGGEPWWPTHIATGGGLSIQIQVVAPEQEWVPYPDVGGADDKSRRYWEAYPSDEAEYERFVEHVLRRASVIDPGEAKSLPFSTGLRDGLDARATIQHWQDGEIYVREEQRGRMRFTNGAIDWVNDSEHAPMLQGREVGGWIDPNCRKVGSVSWESDSRGREVIQSEPYTLQIDHRAFSMITLDAPNESNPIDRGDRQTFYKSVIKPLVDMHVKRTPSDNLYGWLEVMFEFCAGKPFAYLSRYVPSPRIFSIAAKYDVKVMHLPLRTIPSGLLRRHQDFRLMEMSPAQFRELIRQMAAHGLGDMAATLRAHDSGPN